MQPLETTKQVLMWACMYPVAESSNTPLWKTAARVMVVVLLISLSLCAVTACMTYIILNISTNLDDCLFTFMAFTAYSSLIYTMIIAFFVRSQVPSVFDQLTSIYDEHDKDIDSMRFLMRTNDICEWMWSIYRKIVLFFIVNVLITYIISVLIYWLLYGDLIADHFFHPLKIIVPWNQSTILGYLEEQIFDCITIVVFFIVNGMLLLPFISICIHYRAFYQITQNLVDQWNGSIENHRTADTNNNDRKFICDLIRFDVSFKELFSRSATIYSPFIMAQLITVVIILAICLFQIDLSVQEHKYNTIATSLMGFMTGIMFLLPYCFFGKLTTESFAEMGNCVYNLNWPHLLIELQKFVILMIANMQQSIFYHGSEIVTFVI